jgi:acyl-coenzyme A synthetase/AMP-(fatty) acid ligase
MGILVASIVRQILSYAMRFPDRTAIMLPEKAITFRMLLSGVCCVEARLANIALNKDKPIGVFIEDPVWHIVISLALMKSGVCAVALRPDCVKHAAGLGVSAIISSTPVSSQEIDVFTVDNDWFQNSDIVYNVNVQTAHRDRITRVEFTSGSTGVPKAVGLTANNIYNQTVNRVVAYSLSSDNLMSMFKLTTNIGFGLALAQLSLGQTISFADANDSAIDMINYHRIGTLAGSPDQIRRLCGRAEATDKGFDSLVKTILAGSIVGSREIFEMQLVLGSLIQIDYGSTETGPVASYLSSDFKRKGDQEVQFIPHQDVDFVPCQLGSAFEQKEIRLRSTGMGWPFSGIVTQTEGDRGDGWFYPRDIAEKMDDGSFVLVGRSDFLLNFGGVKFSPERLEADLSKRFGLNEVAVVEGKEGSEAVTVLHIAHSATGSLTRTELDSWAIEVHPTIRIGSIRAFSQLPRTASNKLDRLQLRSLF